MKENKSILIIVAVLFILLTMVVIYFGFQEKEEESNENNTNINDLLDDSKKYPKSYYLVNDYNDFYSVQNSINMDNLTEIITVLEVVTNEHYYFIKGLLLNYDMDESITNEGIVYYVMEKEGNKFSLVKIDEKIDDLLIYAKNYNGEYDIELKDKRYKSTKISTENVITLYIEYFKTLLNIEPKEAYNLLSKKTKKKYDGIDDFINQKDEIYNSITSKVFGYTFKENDDNITYQIEDDYRNKIEIVEKNIMNFEISY